MPEIQEDQTFTRITSMTVFSSHQFREHRIVNCDFSSANLGGILFIDCTFEDCNLSLANMSGTGLQNIRHQPLPNSAG